MSDLTSFFVFSRAASGGAEPDPALNEEHWAYMDRFADGMIARGPTLTADRRTWTGSVHIVELLGAQAAREFVEREPYNRAGLFAQHLVFRFDNLLGRTMWESPGRSDDPRFMILAHLPADARERGTAATPIDVSAVAPERRIVHGELLTLDDARPVGVVVALQAPTRQQADAILRTGRDGRVNHLDIETHAWEFGGRR